MKAQQLGNFVGKASKAFMGATLAGLTALGGYLINNTSLGDITTGQWVYVAIAFLGTFAAVWGVPLKK